MRITANQVTAVRLLLLPAPMALLYLGGRGPMLAALGLFILLGLTDALDGYLARKYGSTPIGALLDPVADKIFLVAGYVPLVDIMPVPSTLVVLLFVRELGITALRSVAMEEGFRFRTSELAKLKTVVQMGGAGFILLLWLFPEERYIRPLLGLAVAVALVPAAADLWRRKLPGRNAVWSAVLVGAIAAFRLVFPPVRAMTWVLILIVGFTLVSGVEYVWGMRKVLAARIRRTPVELLRLSALSLAVPLLYLPALERFGAPTMAILVLLAAEIAVGGLDNSLVQMGRRRGPLADLVRAAIQTGCGIVVVRSVVDSAHPGPGRLIAVFACAYTVAEVAIRFWRNRRAFS
jgi:CDP-diacylglycerol--glycerol-3-phosphate 3-phosphatidyltransferase